MLAHIAVYSACAAAVLPRRRASASGKFGPSTGQDQARRHPRRAAPAASMVTARSSAPSSSAIATGRFAALGRPIDLSIVRAPIFFLTACDDEIVAPEQLLAARHLVGSNEHQIRTEIVACTHLGLFMGATTLLDTWSKVAHWLAAC
jgi:hypothetical protein